MSYLSNCSIAATPTTSVDRSIHRLEKYDQSLRIMWCLGADACGECREEEEERNSQLKEAVNTNSTSSSNKYKERRMRIKKNKKSTTSKIVGSSSIPLETLQAHVCLLNRSPWDLFISSQYQDDSFGVNGSVDDSIEGPDSESTKLSLELEEKLAKNDDDDNDGGRHSRTFRSFNSDTSGGDGRQCRRIRSDEHSLRGQNQPSLVPLSSVKSAANTIATAAPRKRGRPRKYREVPPPSPPQVPMEPPIVFPSYSTNPINLYEFYNYYPGLGLHWGK
ncbi:hypothetical protein Droror1_Dr00025246 [Drosera rotundifolia]